MAGRFLSIASMDSSEGISGRLFLSSGTKKSGRILPNLPRKLARILFSLFTAADSSLNVWKNRVWKSRRREISLIDFS